MGTILGIKSIIYPILNLVEACVYGAILLIGGGTKFIAKVLNVFCNTFEECTFGVIIAVGYRKNIVGGNTGLIRCTRGNDKVNTCKKCAKYSSNFIILTYICLLYTSPSPRDGATSRMPSSA